MSTGMSTGMSVDEIGARFDRIEGRIDQAIDLLLELKSGIESAKPKPKAKKPPEPKCFHKIPASLNVESFVTAWKRWIIYRGERKKPLTASTARAQLMKLERWGPSSAILSIEDSIEQGWQGLFDPAQTAKAKAWAKEYFPG